MRKMNNIAKLFYSLLVGIIAAGIAKLVHPIWSINHLLIFGLIVFVVTFIIVFIVESLKRK